MNIKKSIPLYIIIFVTFSPLIDNFGKLGICILCITYLSLTRKSEYLASGDGLSTIVLTYFFIIHPVVLDYVNIYNYDNNISLFTFYFATNLLMGKIITTHYSHFEILYRLEKLVVLAVLTGIPIYLIAYFTNTYNTLPTYTYYHTVHHTAAVVNFLTLDEQLVPRFASFTSEPGLAQFIIAISLANRLDRLKSLDVSSLALITGMVLTRSTAGYILLSTIILFNYKIFIRHKWITAPIFISLLASGAIHEEITWQLENKLMGSYAFDSRFSRISDTTNEWDIIDLITGKGNLFYETYLSQAGLGAWDSIGQLLQRYGIISIISIFSLILINQKRLIISIIIIATFFSQPIWFLPTVSIFYFRRKSK